MVGARPHRPGRPRQTGLGGLDEGPQGIGFELGEQEGEVEPQVELVALAVEGGQLGDVEDVGLAQQETGRPVGVGDPAPSPQHVG